MKITALNPLSAAPASGDLVAIVDVSDTSMAASGSTKKITATNLLAGLLPLAGGTLTGNLSLGTNVLSAGGLSVGTTPAAAGALRLTNAAWVASRNAVNNADVNMIRLNATDYVELGANTIIGPNTPSGNDPQLFVRKDYTGLQSGNQNTAYFYAQAKGAYNTGHVLYNVLSQVQEPSVTANKTITNATRVSTTITITANGHGYANGDRVIVDSVTHTFNQEINGTWVISNVTANTFDYTVAGVSSGAYTSGGIATNRPGYAAYLALVAPAVTRGGLVGTNLHADDVNGFFVSNNGTAKATDPFYIGRNSGLATEWDTTGSYDGAATYGLLINNVVGSNTQVVRGTAYGASATPEFQGRMARGTFEAPRRAKNADLLARLAGVPFVAADDSTNATAAGQTTRIDMFANEDQTASAQGSRIVFYTTPLTTAALTEKLRIANADGIDFSSGTFTTYSIRFKDGGNSNITFGTSTGTKIGTATNEKFAFHNSTPVIQRAGAAQAAVATTAATQTTPWGFTTQAQADAIVTLVNELRAMVVEKGLMKGSA